MPWSSEDDERHHPNAGTLLVKNFRRARGIHGKAIMRFSFPFSFSATHCLPSANISVSRHWPLHAGDVRLFFREQIRVFEKAAQQLRVLSLFRKLLIFRIYVYLSALFVQIRARDQPFGFGVHLASHSLHPCKLNFIKSSLNPFTSVFVVVYPPILSQAGQMDHLIVKVDPRVEAGKGFRPPPLFSVYLFI